MGASPIPSPNASRSAIFRCWPLRYMISPKKQTPYGRSGRFSHCPVRLWRLAYCNRSRSIRDENSIGGSGSRGTAGRGHGFPMTFRRTGNVTGFMFLNSWAFMGGPTPRKPPTARFVVTKGRHQGTVDISATNQMMGGGAHRRAQTASIRETQITPASSSEYAIGDMLWLGSDDAKTCSMLLARSRSADLSWTRSDWITASENCEELPS